MAASIAGNRLLKELKRGGKKTFVLAALLLVGVVIWVPMIWGAVFGKSEGKAGSASKATSSKVEAGAGAKKESTSQTTEEPAKPTATVTDWKSLYRRLEKSSMLQPVTLDDVVRDPFDQEWIRELKRPAAKVDSDTPSDQDPIRSMELTATLAGNKEGAAIIGDRTYRVGDEVPKKGPIRYVVKEIRQDRVLLERAGHVVEIRMKDSGVGTEELNAQDP